MTARPGLQWSDGAAGPFLGHDVIVALPSGGFGLSPDEAAGLGWQDRALCAQTDPEAFFPEKGGSTREAKKVCRGCEVRAECLEYAVEHGERFGIWGGLSERERRHMRPAAPALVAAGEKRCPACETLKPASEFWRNRARLDGLSAQCKSCVTASRPRRAAA